MRKTGEIALALDSVSAFYSFRKSRFWSIAHFPSQVQLLVSNDDVHNYIKIKSDLDVFRLVANAMLWHSIAMFVRLALFYEKRYMRQRAGLRLRRILFSSQKSCREVGTLGVQEERSKRGRRYAHFSRWQPRCQLSPFWMWCHDIFFHCAVRCDARGGTTRCLRDELTLICPCFWALANGKWPCLMFTRVMDTS